MKPEQLFGQTFSCKCGKSHHIEPGEIIYTPDAVAQLPNVAEKLKLGHHVAILMDDRTREVAGREVAARLSTGGWRVKEVVVADRAGGGWPICDDTTKHELEVQIEKPDWILTVGAGVISDLGKWVAADKTIPFLCFATAASMNGYASANVAPTIAGVKSLLRAHPPRAVFSSSSILSEAPYELTSAGLGDVLAKTVSTADWYLNHFLFGDYYCEESASLIVDIEPMYLGRPKDIRSRNPEAIEALFQALLLTGVSMTMAESSSPSSGGEHMVSHTLDMMSSIDGKDHDLHGRQVGVGTILATALYRRVLSVENPVFLEPQMAVDTAFWGPHGMAVSKDYAEKVSKLQTVKEKLLPGEAWDRLRRKLMPMLHPPEMIKECLKTAEAATRAEDIGCSRARLSDAFRHAHEIRSRFTILDLANLLGIMPDAADEIVETWT